LSLRLAPCRVPSTLRRAQAIPHRTERRRTVLEGHNNPPGRQSICLVCRQHLHRHRTAFLIPRILEVIAVRAPAHTGIPDDVYSADPGFVAGNPAIRKSRHIAKAARFVTQLWHVWPARTNKTTSSPKAVGCKSMADALSPTMTLREFENGYWYLDQLKDFAERIGIPAAKKLRKDEIE